MYTISKGPSKIVAKRRGNIFFFKFSSLPRCLVMIQCCAIKSFLEYLNIKEEYK